ncbi:alpha/beta-hydrolase [Schizophyllum commune H4-8]|uniref:Peptidase S33 tripeptidyl aminopeptidase-like C-terminal domain-containing protein n=1 Tax=Schizophyllum commune (strain H4-8 / FGSC 9210) TaxID=578458 RepID=D8Q7J2_SCHCM|nr:alpha/beta-hydrolase [Schizophyllum commune H4-8]KAI5891464.1 alpha/beta-hydrolase [Schizophyllum commune H4-8]
MARTTSLFPAGVIIVAGQALGSSATARNAGVAWFSCGDFDPQYSAGDAQNITCGYYEVPLDYADETVGTAKLAVVKYPATGERVGTLFVNPGGPGNSGVAFVVEYGANLSAITGGNYDLVSWDPRGSDGFTDPGPPTCFNSAAEYYEYYNGTLQVTGIDIKGNLSDGDQVAELYSHVGEMEAKLKGEGQRCAAGKNGDTLHYIGTAATARDLVSLADYLEPGVQGINYWGVSYGTMLGITFVNMFPERVGRVVLDGCMDPILYMTEPSTQYFLNSLESSDETFAGFTAACAMAGKAGCPLVKNDNDTAADIEQHFQDMLDLAHNLTIGGADMSQVPTSAEARVNLYNTLQLTQTWSSAAGLLHDWGLALEALAANESVPAEIAAELSSMKTNFSVVPSHANEAILCSDVVDAGNMTMRDGFDAIVSASENVSPLFGPQWGNSGNACFAWPVRAVERYTGPWDNKPKNPVLIIGNTADPITPFKNAQLMADLLGDSAVLVRQDGLGHTSLAEQSSCTIGIINKYFTEGSLPENDATVCEIDDSVVLFPNPNVTQASVRRSILDATYKAG